MEWSGRAPAPPASDCWEGGECQTEHRHVQQINSAAVEFLIFYRASNQQQPFLTVPYFED